MTVPAPAPPRVGMATASLASVVAVGSVATAGVPALAVGTLGLVVLVTGLTRARGDAVTAGASLQATGALVAGMGGAHPFVVLVALVAAVVAWDVGWMAVDLGVQLGETVPVTRALGIHAVASWGVGLAIFAVGVAVFRVSTGGQPVAALLLLLVAAVLVGVSLD